MPKRSKPEIHDLQKKASALLSEGLSQSEVAHRLGVTVRTLQRWKKNPVSPETVLNLEQKFSQILQETVKANQEEVPEISTEQILKRIQTLIPIALDTVGGILENPEARNGDKLKACQLLGNWSGWATSLGADINLAIATVIRAGYLVTDPTLPVEKKEAGGLTVEMANVIKALLLGISDVDEQSIDASKYEG